MHTALEVQVHLEKSLDSTAIYFPPAGRWVLSSPGSSIPEASRASQQVGCKTPQLIPTMRASPSQPPPRNTAHVERFLDAQGTQWLCPLNPDAHLCAFIHWPHSLPRHVYSWLFDTPQTQQLCFFGIYRKGLKELHDSTCTEFESLGPNSQWAPSPGGFWGSLLVKTAIPMSTSLCQYGLHKSHAKPTQFLYWNKFSDWIPTGA